MSDSITTSSYKSVQMHTQIGNAVAWPQSEALGRELLSSLFKKWKNTGGGNQEGGEDDAMEL